MNRLLAAFVVAFVLAPPAWWSNLVDATAVALGFSTAAEEATNPEPPESSTSDSGASWDPNGG